MYTCENDDRLGRKTKIRHAPKAAVLELSNPVNNHKGQQRFANTEAKGIGGRNNGTLLSGSSLLQKGAFKRTCCVQQLACQTLL